MSSHRGEHGSQYHHPEYHSGPQRRQPIQAIHRYPTSTQTINVYKQTGLAALFQQLLKMRKIIGMGWHGWDAMSEMACVGHTWPWEISNVHVHVSLVQTVEKVHVVEFVKKPSVVYLLKTPSVIE